MTDDKHYNLWEEWFKNAYRIQDFTSLNTLWLSYFITGSSVGSQNQHNILKQVFQTVYTSLPELIGILFLVRKYITNLTLSVRVPLSFLLPTPFGALLSLIITSLNQLSNYIIRWRCGWRRHTSLLWANLCLLLETCSQGPWVDGNCAWYPQRLRDILLVKSPCGSIHRNQKGQVRGSRRFGRCL